MSRPNTPERSIALYIAGSPYFCGMMIIGLSTVNVTPATTGSRTPKILRSRLRSGFLSISVS